MFCKALLRECVCFLSFVCEGRGEGFENRCQYSDYVQLFPASAFLWRYAWEFPPSFIYIWRIACQEVCRGGLPSLSNNFFSHSHIKSSSNISILSHSQERRKIVLLSKVYWGKLVFRNKLREWTNVEEAASGVTCNS